MKLPLCITHSYYLMAKLINFYENMGKEGVKINILIIKFLEETNGKENGTATGKDLS